MRQRPEGFVDAETVAWVIGRSIGSALAWGEKTNDAWHDTEEKVSRLYELKDIIIELQWRYGEEGVEFKFTKKKEPNTIALGDIMDTVFWGERIRIDEDPQISRVYINF